MQITSILHDQLDQPIGLYIPIKRHCSQFLGESKGLPLLKNLSTQYGDVHKVKIRHHRSTDDFSETFNESFDHHNLRQRAVFAVGETSFVALLENTEPFFVLPKNGYKFMYCPEVTDSGSQFKQSFQTIIEKFGNDQKAVDVMTDVLKYTYKRDNLFEAIGSGAEVVLYDIPFYYAVRCSTIRYDDLLSLLK